MQNIAHCIPIFTTPSSFPFTAALCSHWQRKPAAKYLMWWAIGTFFFGTGRLTESINALSTGASGI